MQNSPRSIARLLLTICLVLPFVVTPAAMAQEKKTDDGKKKVQSTSLKFSVTLPNGKPAPNATVIRHAQFANGKPVWIAQRLGEGRNSKPLVGNKEGKIDWKMFDIGRSSPICLILSSDQKFGAFFPLKGINLDEVHNVELQRMIAMKARFENPQAMKADIPFLHRGYIYLGTGERFAHVVGESAEIFLPKGFYEMNGYNGNGNNIQVEVPKFRFQFNVSPKKVSDVLLIEGDAKVESFDPKNKGVFGLGKFSYGDGVIAFKPNTLLSDYEGTNRFTIHFKGPDGKAYRGKRVFVQERSGRNTYVYYGKMPESGVLDIGDVTEGTYQVSIDGHVPRACYSIVVKDDEPFPVEQVVAMPVMPGYTLDNLHLLDPKTLEKKDLKGYQGKVVYIEFWASWCGPCMQAMNHVEAILSKRKENWGDKVALVAVNVNEDPEETIAKYTKIHGWNSFQHLYGGDEGKNDFKAPALKQLQINGIPHAMILGPDGKMIWRGHPESIDVGVAIEKALKMGKK